MQRPRQCGWWRIGSDRLKPGRAGAFRLAQGLEIVEMARPFRFNLVSVALELRQESGATRGLTQFSVDEIGSRVGNPRTFVWAVQIILAGLDESVVFDHDEMLVWNERGVSRAVFRD